MTGSASRIPPWAAWGLPAMAVLILAGRGVEEPGVRELIRWTARTSLVFFSAAFAGPAAGAWLARRRDAWLKGLALSHAIHGLAVASLAVLTRGANLLERASVENVVGGLGAYVFIAVGAFRPQSPVLAWGLYWVWAVFVVGYLGRALRAPAVFGPAIALLVVVLILRLAGSLSRAPRPLAEPAVPDTSTS